MLCDSIETPTKCTALIQNHPNLIGVKDASKHSVGRVVIGKHLAVPPTVFHVQWPASVIDNLVSIDNPDGTITNSDFECGGLLYLWVVVEYLVDRFLQGNMESMHVALFSNNSPTVSWVQQLASRGSIVAMYLLGALAFCLHRRKTSPLSPLHISGTSNQMTNIPSCSFGSVKK